MKNNIEDLKIGVVGGGSWGTALANLLAQKGWPIDLWVFEKEVQQQIRDDHENKVFLPGIRLSENLYPTNDLGRVVADKDFLLTVVPSHLVRDVAKEIGGFIAPETVVVSASKGIENGTHLTMTQVLREVLPAASAERISVLSGPSFAREVAVNVPTVVTVAARDPEVALDVQQVFATPYFRVYTSDDPMGVELGGAVKNVIAIAAGIVDGLGLGLNTRAALITRGQTEIRRLGVEMGANPRTFTGLAGIGDLILTCTGDLSRNHMVGKEIGRGRTLKAILADMRMVAEGVKTSQSVYNLARKRGVEMPITTEVYNVLYHGVPPKEALFRLMTRDLKGELDEK